MAKSQLVEILTSYQGTLEDLIRWLEDQLVRLGETIYLDELELSPSDITEYPASIHVDLEPQLPQNMIAEGTFYDRMQAAGHVSRRIVREKGLNLDDPSGMDDEVLIENVKDALKPQLVLDIIAAVSNPQPMAAGQNGAVPAGEGSNVNVNMDVNGAAARPGIGRSMGQELGGMTRAGQSREPSNTPGTTL
jgi:hypothetical protein